MSEFSVTTSTSVRLSGSAPKTVSNKISFNQLVHIDDKVHHFSELFKSIKVDGGIVIDKSQGVYFGEMTSDGMKNGEGTYYYPDDKQPNAIVLTGEWKNDKLNGYGTKSQFGKVIFEGEFENGRFHGQGKYYYAHGDIYEGEWCHGLKQGKGSMCYYIESNKNISRKYVGEWLDGHRHGNGVMTYYNSDGMKIESYDGAWKVDKRHGKGKFFFANGNRMEGEYYDDLPAGKYVIVDKQNVILETVVADPDTERHTSIKIDASGSTRVTINRTRNPADSSFSDRMDMVDNCCVIA